MQTIDSSLLRNVFFLLCAIATLVGNASAFDVHVTVAVDKPGREVNRLILGNNVQWVDRGDELITADGRQFQPQMLERARILGPTVLRFPGGSMSDLYHWKDGIGEPAQRGLNEHFFSRQMQRVLMGTREFLELCESLGAEPLITVNTATAPPEEAAEWVDYVNRKGLRSSRTGRPLPRVRYWELGNEPYLRDDKQKRLWIAPEAFAARANAFIQAMRRVDPGIEIGVPLRSDRIGGVSATPYPGYNEVVLRNISARFEFVALHSAYLPLAFDKRYQDRDFLLAALAAPQTVAADFDATRRQLQQFKPGRTIKLAVTEYNAFFSHGGMPSDDYIASPAGAMYVADLLRLFTETPDLLLANFWSLSGNWRFGAFAGNGRPRPAYHVLSAFHRVLRGRMLPVSIDAPGFNSPAVGFVPEQRGQSKVTALATLDNGTTRAILINKDPVSSAAVMLNVAGMESGRGKADSLVVEMPFDLKEGDDIFARRALEIRVVRGRMSIQLPALSITVVELRAQR